MTNQFKVKTVLGKKAEEDGKQLLTFKVPALGNETLTKAKNPEIEPALGYFYLSITNKNAYIGEGATEGDLYEITIKKV